MPRKSFNDENVSRGRNFEKICEILFPGDSRRIIGAKLGGVSEGTIRNWEEGKPIANKALAELERRGVSLAWLFRSEGERFVRLENDTSVVKESFPVAPSEEFPLAYAGSRVEISIPTPGGAAAATDGQNTFFVDSEEDPLVIPKGVCCVRVYGDSMAPIALDRQRVFLRPAGPEPKKDDLVVVWTNEGGTFQSYFKRWLGWRRSETGGRELVLESQNITEGNENTIVIPGEIFDDVRIVSGVWFG